MICPASGMEITISIHAPRVGSDGDRGTPHQACGHFNPRSPCGERPQAAANVALSYNDFNPRSPCGERRSGSALRREHRKFQSTLPVWGATRLGISAKAKIVFQSTLPVWGATMTCLLPGLWRVFQSTLPVWGATAHKALRNYFMEISIHAPRVGSDGTLKATEVTDAYFNPRSPCGERPRHHWHMVSK